VGLIDFGFTPGLKTTAGCPVAPGLQNSCLGETVAVLAAVWSKVKKKAATFKKLLLN
jgi:hypothetical protein